MKNNISQRITQGVAAKNILHYGQIRYVYLCIPGRCYPKNIKYQSHRNCYAFHKARNSKLLLPADIQIRSELRDLKRDRPKQRWKNVIQNDYNIFVKNVV